MIFSTQDWEVQIDVSVPQPGFSESVFGLGVTSGTNTDFNNASSDSNNHLQMSLFESSRASGFSSNKFLMKFGVKGGGFPGVAEAPTTSTFAGLRIAFDASTKVLSTFYDEDGPVNGYSWTFLGSTNISTAWKMTSTNVFGVHVFGRAEAVVVASTDNVFGDNFCASSGPRLGINLAGGKAVLSWRTNTPGYHLQSASALPSPVGWQNVTDMPRIVGSNFTVTNVLSSGKALYRLSR